MDLAEILPLAIKASIALTVVGLGLTATLGDGVFLFRHPGLLLRSLLSMNVLMPLVAVGCAVAFDMPDSVEIALVALAVSPVPPILPTKELKAGGTRPYTLGLLVAIGLCSIVVVPVTVSTSSRHPAIALAVAVSGGAGSKPELAAILLYLIVATLVAVPYLAWRKRQRAALAAPVGSGP